MRHSAFRFLTASVLALSFSLPGNLAWAKGGHPGGIGKAIKQLDLSSEQQAKLADLKKQGRDKLKEARKAVRENRKKLEAALKSDVSKDELLKLHETLQKSMTSEGNLRFEKILSIREVLTQEQRIKFHELTSKHEAKKGKGHRKSANPVTQDKE